MDIHMKLGESGEAFFVEEVPADELGDDEFIPPHLACSPIPVSSVFAGRFLVTDDQDVDDQTWKGLVIYLNAVFIKLKLVSDWLTTIIRDNSVYNLC